jgi:hypothetical protein
MGLGGSFQLRATEADPGMSDDDSRALLLRASGMQNLFHRGEIVPIHFQYIPPIAFEPFANIITVGEVGGAFDGDPVTVIECNQLVQAQMTSERECFVRDALHQISIAAQDIGIMIHHVVTGSIEPLGQHGFGQRHTHGIATTLAQRTGGGFHAGRVPVFRMSRCATAPLPELLEVFQFQVIAGQVQQTVDEHGAVTGRLHIPVTIRPHRMHRIMLQELEEQHTGKIGRTQGHARMSGIGSLHTIHGQPAHGVGNSLHIHNYILPCVISIDDPELPHAAV